MSGNIPEIFWGCCQSVMQHPWDVVGLLSICLCNIPKMLWNCCRYVVQHPRDVSGLLLICHATCQDVLEMLSICCSTSPRCSRGCCQYVVQHPQYTVGLLTLYCATSARCCGVVVNLSSNILKMLWRHCQSAAVLFSNGWYDIVAWKNKNESRLCVRYWSAEMLGTQHGR
jgi:hypothetical protein